MHPHPPASSSSMVGSPNGYGLWILAGSTCCAEATVSGRPEAQMQCRVSNLPPKLRR